MIRDGQVRRSDQSLFKNELSVEFKIRWVCLACKRMLYRVWENSRQQNSISPLTIFFCWHLMANKHIYTCKMRNRSSTVQRRVRRINYEWLCNRNHVVTQWLSRKIRLRRTALAFSFNFQQSSRVTFNQKTDCSKTIKAPSDWVR